MQDAVRFFDSHLTANLPRNLPVKNIVNPSRFDRIMVMTKSVFIRRNLRSDSRRDRSHFCLHEPAVGAIVSAIIRAIGYCILFAFVIDVWGGSPAEKEFGAREKATDGNHFEYSEMHATSVSRLKAGGGGAEPL